jgi:DNA invertase Pin-like site-specific DNA recombinase
MTNADPLPATVLSRKAVVYVRQSTQTQVQVHRESQRRQYDLVEDARRRGFRDVEVIDDDLGRSASGTVARPGFERLVASLCAGEVGAVLCFDASRLSATGGTGIISSSYAVSSAPVSSILTASMTRAVPMIACCWA